MSNESVEAAMPDEILDLVSELDTVFRVVAMILMVQIVLVWIPLS